MLSVFQMVFGSRVSKESTSFYPSPPYCEKDDFVQRWVAAHQPYMSSQRPQSPASSSGVIPIYYSIRDVDRLRHRPNNSDGVHNPTDRRLSSADTARDCDRLQSDGSSDDGYASVYDQPLSLEDLDCSPQDTTPSRTRNINGGRRQSNTQEWVQWRKEVNTRIASDILAKRDGVRLISDTLQIGRMSALSMCYVARKAAACEPHTEDFILYGLPRANLQARR